MNYEKPKTNVECVLSVDDKKIILVPCSVPFVAHVMQFINRFTYLANEIIEKHNDENNLSKP